jgi:hypothetical protein
MVTEKLEVLKHIQGSFGHRKVEETSELDSKWNHVVDIGTNFGQVIVVSED